MVGVSRISLGVCYCGLNGSLAQSVVYGFKHLTIAEALTCKGTLRTEKPTVNLALLLSVRDNQSATKATGKNTSHTMVSLFRSIGVQRVAMKRRICKVFVCKHRYTNVFQRSPFLKGSISGCFGVDEQQFHRLNQTSQPNRYGGINA